MTRLGRRFLEKGRRSGSLFEFHWSMVVALAHPAAQQKAPRLPQACTGAARWRTEENGPVGESERESERERDVRWVAQRIGDGREGGNAGGGRRRADRHQAGGGRRTAAGLFLLQTLHQRRQECSGAGQCRVAMGTQRG